MANIYYFVFSLTCVVTVVHASNGKFISSLSNDQPPSHYSPHNIFEQDNLIGVPPIRVRNGPSIQPEYQGTYSSSPERHEIGCFDDKKKCHRKGREFSDRDTLCISDDDDHMLPWQRLSHDKSADLLQIPCSLLLDTECDQGSADTKVSKSLLRTHHRCGHDNEHELDVIPPNSKDSIHATPLTTYLDTGAQVTILTYHAAKKAGLVHLIDTRYEGHAIGVSGVSCRVLGRIPANTVSFIFDLGVGGEKQRARVNKSPAITVLDNQIINENSIGHMEMLLGLDVLEEWQAKICFRDRTLTVRNAMRRRNYSLYNTNTRKLSSCVENGEIVVIPFVDHRVTKTKNSERSRFI